MMDVKLLLTRLEEELEELQKQMESPEVDQERKKALTVLIKRFISLRRGDRIISLAKVVHFGWVLTPITKQERSKLISYRESCLARLRNNGLDQKHMDLALQLKDHIFYGGKDLPNFMDDFAERVKEIVQRRDRDLPGIINGIGEEFTCNQLLDEVMRRYSKPPTPHIEIEGPNLLQRKVYNTKKAAGKSDGLGVTSLREWLSSDNTKVIEFLTIPGKSEKDSYLSDGFRKIMRSATDKVRIVHRHGLIHGNLSLDTILVRHHDLDVRLTCHYKQGNPDQDFESLKSIIESALVSHEKDYPADVSLFLGKKSERNLMYIHPYLWSTYDFIYVIETIRIAYEMDRDAIIKWTEGIPMTSHEVFENKIKEFQFLKSFYEKREDKYKKTDKKMQPLFFMRDANHHLVKSIKDPSDSSYYSIMRATRMAQLACPGYIVQFMQVIVNKMQDGKISESPIIKEMLDGYFKG